MCKMASFLYKNSEEGLEVVVWDLMSHNETQKNTYKTEKMGWYEGHYTPQGVIECRTLDGRDTSAEEKVKERWKSFISFLNWAVLKYNGGSLDLHGCDLKGIELPEVKDTIIK